MGLQSKFRTFDEAIKLKRFDENAELREKRDRVLTRLRDGLARAQRPTFEPFNQGSYDMGTGVKPVAGDFDIDVGLVFNIDKAQYPDPVKVKEWVFTAVNGHTQKPVGFRRPCITVFYSQGGEPLYHVDLAVYAKDMRGGLHLATGKQNSSADQRKWVQSSPRDLTDLISKKHSGDDADQFRRVIRYLKRWKDFGFSVEGNAAPRGIALTACAYLWFTPGKKTVWDVWNNKVEYDDLSATHQVVSSMISAFSWSGRLSVQLPLPPGNDLFARMSDQQMVEFKQRLVSLRDALSAAASLASSNEPEACRRLARVFGPDFPA
ncbi:MAG: hypothetical protein AMXMBFR58_36430 [Phycisphaerae bacterium]